MIEKALSEMSEISLRIARRRDAFVNLHYVNALPWEILSCQCAQHDPGRMPTAYSHNETTACGDGGPSFLGNRFRRRMCSCLLIWKDFNLHRCFFPHGLVSHAA